MKAALKNGELTPAQVREVVITLANYAGYPRAAAQVVATEQTIAAVEKEKKGPRMTKRAYDPEFEAILPLLPTLSDLSSAEKIQAVRSGRMEMFALPPDREDVAKEDRRVPGPAGRARRADPHLPPEGERERARAAACSRSTAAAS